MTYLHTTVLERDVIHVMCFTTADTINVLSTSNVKRFPLCEGHCDYGDFNLGSELEGYFVKRFARKF